MSPGISSTTSPRFISQEHYIQKAKEDPVLEVVAHGKVFAYCLRETHNRFFADLEDLIDVEIRLLMSICETSLSESESISEGSSSGNLEVLSSEDAIANSL